MDKSDQLRVIGNVTGFIIFALITIPVFFYYIWRRQDFNIHPRAGKLSLLSGLYCIVTSLVVFARGFSKDYDSEDPDSISCDVLHALGFIFPSCFVSPYIFRALKVVVQWENIEPLARFVSVRFSAVVIVLTSVVYTLVGVLVLRDSDNLIGGSNCVAFNHWVYFVVFYTIILVITFPLILKLRTVKDKFYIARELKVQFIILSIYIFTYLIIVICISSESVSKEDVLDNFDLNYYLALLCGASFYVSFIDPYRSGFRRGDPDEDNNVTSTSVLRKPFDSIVINVNLENLMSMTLEEVINSDGLFEVLKRVAQRALCPELIHFIQAARAYKANAEALALQSQSAHVSRDSFSAGTRSYAMPPRRKTMSSADSFVTQWYRRMMPSSDSKRQLLFIIIQWFK